MTALDGWICLDKPSGITSNLAMIKVRRLVQNNTGYLGTLDPFATGILPIAVGRARKFLQFIENKKKKYVCSIKFGAMTDSLDRDGTIIAETNTIPSLNEIQNVIPKFIGEIDQIPPQYSAIKINGRRACDLIRRGQNVTISARRVHIHDLQILDYKDGACTLEIECSKGTYIRSLARDIAEQLGGLAYVQSLRRTQCGFFCESRAISIENLEKIVDNQAASNVLIPIDDPLGDIPALYLDSMQTGALLQGRVVSSTVMCCEYVRIFDKTSRKFCGICKMQQDGGLKPFKMYL